MSLALETMKELFEIVKCLYALRNELKLKSRKFTQLGLALKQHLLLALESGTVYLVTSKSVNPLSVSRQKSEIGFLKTALANFVNLISNKSATCKLRTKCLIIYYNYPF